MPDFYGTFAGYNAYQTARNRAISADQSDLEAALLVASEWIDGRHRSSFPGTKVGLRGQLREWPRVGGVDINGYSISSGSVPTEIENATYEAAARETAEPGALAKDWTPPKYDSVGVTGAVQVKYNRFHDAHDAQTKFPVIAQILAPILTGCGAASPLSGAAARA